MSVYYSFNDFMNRVIKRADELTWARNNCSLEDYYQVSVTTMKAVISLISSGWNVFLAVVAVLALGYLGLGAAILSLMATPIGLVIATALGVGAVGTIRQMYKDRILPQAVKAVGDEYKPRWEAADGNPVEIDQLTEKAAESLYERAKRGLYSLHV